MDVRTGKPLNIARFKRSVLSFEALTRTKCEMERLARFVRVSRHGRPVRECYVCGSGRHRTEASVYGIPYRKCQECGHLYAARRLGADGIEAYYRRDRSYSADYANPSTYRYRLKEVALPKVDFVRRYVKTRRRRWLDVGSGIGDLVVAAERRGFQARGIEISRRSVAFAKKVFGVSLTSETLGDILRSEGPGSYDVVSFFGVLEHIPDMKAQARIAGRLLSDGGILVIEVPNADSVSTLSDFLFPDQVTRHLYPPFHIMAFTRASLTRLVTGFGLRPVALWYFGLDFYNLLVHFGLRSKPVMPSALADFLVSANNEFQEVIDRKGMSDEMLLVSRKVQ